MSALIITKETFSKMKKRLKSVLQETYGVSAKLSDCAQQLATIFGFENEHELQSKLSAGDSLAKEEFGSFSGFALEEHFRKKIDVYANKHPSLLVRQLAGHLKETWLNEEALKLKMVLSAEDYAKLIKKYPEEVDLAKEKEFKHYQIMAFIPINETLDNVLDNPDQRKEVVVQISKTTAIEMASCAISGDSPGPFKFKWINAENTSKAQTTTSKKDVIHNAVHWLKHNQSNIQSLFFSNSPQFGLSLNVTAKSAKYDETAGFGMFYSDEVSKYLDSELSYLNLTLTDIAFLKNLAKQLDLLDSPVRDRLVSEIDLQLELFNNPSPSSEMTHYIYQK